MKIPEGLRRIFRVFSSSYGVFCEVRALEIENHFQEEKPRLPARGCPSPREERPASWTPAWLACGCNHLAPQLVSQAQRSHDNHLARLVGTSGGRWEPSSLRFSPSGHTTPSSLTVQVF